jgi:hypothetical protein
VLQNILFVLSRHKARVCGELRRCPPKNAARAEKKSGGLELREKKVALQALETASLTKSFFTETVFVLTGFQRQL